MQSFKHGQPLHAREMRQNVHAENAVKSSDVARSRQIHAVKSDQAAQTWLHQEVRGDCGRRSCIGSIAIQVRLKVCCSCGARCADFRKIIANRGRRQTLQRRLPVYAAVGRFDVSRQQVAADDVD